MEERSPGLLPLPEVVVQQAAAQEGALLSTSPEGEAYMAQLNNQPCILRVYNTCSYDHFIREKELAEALHHPNLLQALALCDTPGLKAIAYRSPAALPLPQWLATPLSTWHRRLSALHDAACALQAAVAANRRLEQLSTRREQSNNPFPTHGILPRLAPETVFITQPPPPSPSLSTSPPASAQPSATSTARAAHAPSAADPSPPPSTLVLTDWTFFLIGSPLAPEKLRPQEIFSLSTFIHLLVLPPASPLLDSPADVASAVAQAIEQGGSAVGLVHPAWLLAPVGLLRQLLGLAAGMTTSLAVMSPPMIVEEAVTVLRGMVGEAK